METYATINTCAVRPDARSEDESNASVGTEISVSLAAIHVIMGWVLSIVSCIPATHLIKKADFTRKTVQTGAVVPVQRFGSALYLKIHFHSFTFLAARSLHNVHGDTNWVLAIRIFRFDRKHPLMREK